MGKRRLGWVVLGPIALSCLATACGSSSKEASTTTASSVSSIVALGDSVPRGTNCDCTPYPQLTAHGLAASAGRAVTASNDGVAGATTEFVLKQLRSDGDVIGHVRGADVVEIEVGANDVAYSKSCGTAVDCYTTRIPTIGKNLAAIVARTRELTRGHKVLVVLLDYWSVWLGGKYATEQGPAYVDAAEQVTDRVDRVIKATAVDTGSAYVDLRAAFKGPGYAYDETHFLSSDGDHPNAAGHRRIATAAESVIEKTLPAVAGGA